MFFSFEDGKDTSSKGTKKEREKREREREKEGTGTHAAKAVDTDVGSGHDDDDGLVGLTKTKRHCEKISTKRGKKEKVGAGSITK